MTDPVRQTIALTQGDIALLTWPAPGRPRLLAAHGNGFNAMSLKAMLTPLAGRFDIVAADLRGHGRTTLPTDPASHHGWTIFARDLTALMGALDRKPDLLAGHSMGAASLLLAAGAMDNPPPLALIEPVVLPPAVYLAAYSPLWPLFRRRVGLGERARRRSNGWPDRKAVMDRYRAKPPFESWAPGVLEDYLQDGLVDTPDGVRLACDPAWEGANFEANRHNLMAAARKAGQRLHVLQAANGSTVLNPSGLKQRGARLETLEGVSHLAPMENPAGASAWVAQIAAREGILG
ncbi:alpha/beta hydrolase [Alkalicaulis satelles]|uniref:Alpha/beta hydrolase n=1 Tax=Alkalicaulis satelles TaxID=2609175 RepID=A0A5M6ZMY2_9PROT|nr:alpha/beta hydrolase [Alkalicaulis satelles]KAA5804944.1 alpha/beta hydrolase [Alkalicaulis satelles]